MKDRLIPSVLLALLLMVPAVSAGASLTYTLTGGTMTGALGTTPFEGAPYTITAVADPATLVSGFVGPVSFSYLSTTGTIRLEVSPGSFLESSMNSPNFFVLVQPDSPVTGFHAFGEWDLVGVEGHGLAAIGPLIPLDVPGTTTGTPFMTEGGTYVTALGTLTVVSLGPEDVTFSVTDGGEVPEPSTLALAGLGCLMVAAVRRRRRQ
jgi:hypothetical protein